MKLTKFITIVLAGVLGLTFLTFFLVSFISSIVDYQKYYDSYQRENGGSGEADNIKYISYYD